MKNLNRENREFWLERTLKKIPKNSKILDAGAGELQYKKYCGHLKYVAQDFGQYDGNGNQMGLQTEKWDNSKLDIVSDITRIPVSDKSFDAIMCVEVFEHLPDPVLAVKEFSRILKKGGSLILTAPFCSLTHFAPYHFHTGYNRYFYEKILPEYGFKIKEIGANGNYFEYMKQETWRLSFMLQNYSTLPYWIFRPFCLLVELPMVALLSLMAKHNKGSESLLCFGYHVWAVKVR